MLRKLEKALEQAQHERAEATKRLNWGYDAAKLNDELRRLRDEGSVEEIQKRLAA